MDFTRAIDLSWEDFGHGRTRAALDRLKQIVRADPASIAPRRALAEMYRSLGYTDQAARWGCLIDGWLNRQERSILSLHYRGLGRDRVAELTVLPEGAPFPDEVEELLFAGTRDDRRWSVRVAAELDSVARLMGVVAAVVAGIAAVLTAVVAVVGMEDIRLFARVCAMISCVPAILSGTAWFVGSLIKHRWWWALFAAIASTPFVLMLSWLAPSPGAYFPWE